ncbi:hypothetical protein GPALN_011379 [Globodera pallida]|nr:hypothetical protein GPALN_011379 [Globodera pallida]
MTVVPIPTDPSLTNALSTSSPFYYITRECSSSPSSPRAQQKMESFSNNRITNCNYGNDREELSYFERKRKMAVIHRQQRTQPYHHPLPERLQPLTSGQDDLRNSDVLAKWVAVFLPKPEPPRFFRPLCARLSRQQNRLREDQAAYARRCAEHVEEVRARLAMSVSEVRAEQKTALRELRQQRKRGGTERRREESGKEQQQRNGREDGAGDSGNGRPRSTKPSSSSTSHTPTDHQRTSQASTSMLPTTEDGTSTKTMAENNAKMGNKMLLVPVSDGHQSLSPPFFSPPLLLLTPPCATRATAQSDAAAADGQAQRGKGSESRRSHNQKHRHLHNDHRHNNGRSLAVDTSRGKEGRTGAVE